MAQKLQYKLKLFKGSGRSPVAYSRIRFASAFEITYGKRTIIKRTEFPDDVKRVQDKRDYVEEVIFDIELKRLSNLEKRRRKREAEKEKERKVVAKKTLRRKLNAPSTKIEDQIYREYRERIDFANTQIPEFDKAYGLEPATALKATVIDTMVIPVEPESDDFNKRIVDKTMEKLDVGNYHLSIMDFTFETDQVIPMARDNFRQAAQEAMVKMLPHVIRYFESVKESSNLYILRLKFLNRWDQDDEYQDYGISKFRTEIRTAKQLMNLFQQTLILIQGDPNDKMTTKHKLRANYLEGDKVIFIKGFTLEATAM